MRSDFFELFLKDAIGFGTKKMVDFILMSVFMSETQNMNNVDCLQSEYLALRCHWKERHENHSCTVYSCGLQFTVVKTQFTVAVG